MDKDIWLTMLDHLQHQDIMPVVASTLSWARCFGSVVEAGLKWCQLEWGRVGERILGAGVVQGGSLYWPHQNLTKSRLIFDTPYTPNFYVASIASVVEIRFP